MMNNLLKKHRLRLVIIMVLIVGSVAGFLFFPLTGKTTDYKHLVGRWVRDSGGYILDIQNVQSDGKLEAAYLNPKQINVSKAQANIKSGQIDIFIELRDKYYPGSYYTLTYDSQNDRLIGVYHHLGVGQNFDISF